MKLIFTLCSLNFFIAKAGDSLFSYKWKNDVTVTIDFPESFKSNKKTVLIIYALPNGNTTAQTMGKKMLAGDDWHFDIQHIKAQTKFIRQADKQNQYVVAYLENDLKSWPAWCNKTSEYEKQTIAIIDTIALILKANKLNIHLNGHSGGGAFIFGCIRNRHDWDKKITRISFMDSNYRFDTTDALILTKWLATDKKHQLTVLAYNDSVALLNGKTFVSATGGTWYRSNLMIRLMENNFKFIHTSDNDMHRYQSKNKQVNFYLLENLSQKIYHTEQVALNGFIHTELINTKFENKGYAYFKERAYGSLIK